VRSVAGHETTANSLAWTWERLVRFPEAHDRLREAVRSGDRAGEVERVMQEAMRSRPVIPMIGRRVTVPWRLGEYAVPANTPVLMSILLIHHREDLYPDPFAFRPERWEDRTPGTYEWIPFGGGIRRCLGAALAMAEQRVVLETMARRLDLAQREGGCACGAVSYRLASQPMFVHCCHCLNCQRQTGSALVVNLLIEADRVQVLAGAPQPVDAPRDEGSSQRFFRCPDCQVAIFSEYGPPEVRFVRGGTLDDPTGITPDVHIYVRSKVGWVTLPEGTPAFHVYYDHGELWPAESLSRLEAVLPRT
jgi:hypothetical protein